jgi:hypothetical protein
MLGVNLAVKDGRGFPTTLRLAPGETSRELSEEEFSSAELQKFLTKRVFVDVTGFAERQRVAKAALGGGA